MEPMFFERLSTSPDVWGTNKRIESFAAVARTALGR